MQEFAVSKARDCSCRLSHAKRETQQRPMYLADRTRAFRVRIRQIKFVGHNVLNSIISCLFCSNSRCG